MDLIDFMTARLDEDEAVAKGALSGPDDDGKWEVAYPYGRDAAMIRGRGIAMMQGKEQTPHIARHDPDRERREVEADRTLLRELQAAGKEVQGNDIGMAEPLTLRSRGYYAGLLRATMIRATRFADHPDYRAEWKP